MPVRPLFCAKIGQKKNSRKAGCKLQLCGKVVSYDRFLKGAEQPLPGPAADVQRFAADLIIQRLTGCVFLQVVDKDVRDVVLGRGSGSVTSSAAPKSLPLWTASYSAM